MIKKTTITITRPMLDYITSIKGLLEYKSGKKKTLQETLLFMCMYVDLLFAMRMGLIESPNDEKETNKYLEERVKQFFEPREAEEILAEARKIEMMEKDR